MRPCIYLLTDWRSAYVGRAVDVQKRFHRHPALSRFADAEVVECHILEWVDDWGLTADREAAWKDQIRQTELSPVWRTEREYPISLSASVEGGRVSGAIQGRKNVESGQLASLRTQEHQAAGGRISGRNNANNGHLASLRTPEHQRAAGRLGGIVGGRIAGRMAAESGQLASARKAISPNGRRSTSRHMLCSRWHGRLRGAQLCASCLDGVVE